MRVLRFASQPFWQQGQIGWRANLADLRLLPRSGKSFANFPKSLSNISVSGQASVIPRTPRRKGEIAPRIRHAGENGLIKVGKLAPDFKYVDLKCHVKHLYDFREKMLLLRFWADWCDYCWKEMPVLGQFYRQTPKGSIIPITPGGPARSRRLHSQHR